MLAIKEHVAYRCGCARRLKQHPQRQQHWMGRMIARTRLTAYTSAQYGQAPVLTVERLLRTGCQA